MSFALALPDLALAAADWRRDGAVVVLAAGCFDPLHLGHVQHLERARALGNVLVVAVAADRMVRAHKGARRPFMPAAVRAGIVAGLRCVDAVVVNHSTTDLIRTLRPHVYAKGTEYAGALTPDLEAEAALLADLGGEMAFVSGDVVLSSSALLAGV